MHTVLYMHLHSLVVVVAVVDVVARSTTTVARPPRRRRHPQAARVPEPASGASGAGSDDRVHVARY